MEKEAIFFREEMKSRGISVNSHYEPLSLSLFAKRNLNIARSTERSRAVAKTLFRLPVWFGMDEATLERVTEETMTILSKVMEGRVE